ncbi:MAG: acyl dehydratase [Rhodobacteraceae bacterium]|nr:acyl dehydratase [Paracoccaceae bacterium]
MSHNQNQRDVMDPARASAFLAALGNENGLETGDILPPFFHQLYFWAALPPEMLGRDGHPKVGLGLIPDLGLPRRMWAGGRLSFNVPLRVGLEAEKRSTLESAVQKTGRTGPLGFVTLKHEIWQEGVLCLTEWQDLVYREDPDPTASRPVPPQSRADETDRREVSFSSTLLFRYSALTFNGHRIHYDENYAREVEGYSGLVVHGPLLAQQLMLMAEDLMGPLAEFAFRASSPLMHSEPAILCRSGHDLWVRGPDGRQCISAVATPR